MHGAAGCLRVFLSGVQKGNTLFEKRVSPFYRALPQDVKKPPAYCSNKNRAIFSIAEAAFLVGNI